MSDTRPIVLGSKVFDIPQLPFRIFIDAYPICQKLCEESIDEGGIDMCVDARIKRALKGSTGIRLSRDELVDLGEVAFLACTAADPAFTRADFDNLPITPWILSLAFLTIKLQTGAWSVATDDQEQPGAGEAQGADAPLT